MVRVLGISGSPRNGNTERLLDAALEGARESGAEVEKIRIHDLDFEGCKECMECWKTGVCSDEDDMQEIYGKLLDADCIILSTPVFFLSLPGKTKAMIDRCQCLWIKKYLLKQRVRDGGDFRGALIACGATEGERLFECVRRPVRAFFTTLDIKLTGELLVRKMEGPKASAKHPTAVRDARALGRALVAGEKFEKEI
jgi:multimeric flavodoxin WrbA